MPAKTTAVIVGAGHRAIVYASYAKSQPNELEIVGVADPSPLRRELMTQMFDLRPDRCFETAEELRACRNSPTSPSTAPWITSTCPPRCRCWKRAMTCSSKSRSRSTRRRCGSSSGGAALRDRNVVICHVLRYAPFYAAIRQRVIDGVIGDILNVQAAEHVSYHHVAVAFVRGKWNRHDTADRHADGEVVPRSRPDHVDEERRPTAARRQLRQQLPVSRRKTRRRARAPAASSIAPSRPTAFTRRASTTSIIPTAGRSTCGIRWSTWRTRRSRTSSNRSRRAPMGAASGRPTWTWSITSRC